MAPEELENSVARNFMAVNGQGIENMSLSKQIVKFVDIVRAGNKDQDGNTKFTTF